MHAMHISNGTYGLILVQPKAGLPKVDREFYVAQGELYTEQKLGTKGESRSISTGSPMSGRPSSL